jgi:hypothetical protein
MKPLVITISGRSGSGKSVMAKYITEEFNIPQIYSYTDRPKRSPNEIGHTFLTETQFDRLKPADMIAYTEFGDYRYCSLKKDIKPVCIYIVDDSGIEMLMNNFYKKYKLYNIRIKRSFFNRLFNVGLKRVFRDKERFYLSDTYFDVIIRNGKLIRFQNDIRNVINIILCMGLNN